jgi:hypothetical protein
VKRARQRKRNRVYADAVEREFEGADLSEMDGGAAGEV